MYLDVSGEGETDIGKSNEAIGPHIQYSLLEAEMLEVVHEFTCSVNY